MRLNAPLLEWSVRRLLAGRGTELVSLASESRTLCPAERATIPPAHHLPGATDRIVALSPWRDAATERLMVDGGTIEHMASVAHVVEDVALRGPYGYRDGAKTLFGYGKRHFLLRDAGPPERIDAAHMMSNWAASGYFGNHMADIYPLELLPEPNARLIAAPAKDFEDDKGYRRLLGRPRPPVVSSAYVARLTIYADVAQNSSKVARYRDLRARLRAALGAPEAPAAGIYLKRGTTGERRVVANEAALEALMTRLGFDVVEPAHLPTEEVVRRLLDARLVIGIEGSQLAHALYTLADGGTLLVLQPPDRFSMDFKGLTDSLDMTFAFIVGAPAPDGFTIDPEELARLIDTIPDRA
jgi:hypothetical protein